MGHNMINKFLLNAIDAQFGILIKNMNLSRLVVIVNIITQTDIDR